MKKISALLVIVMLFSFPVFAQNQEEEVDIASVNQALTVVVDCLSAAVVTNYSNSDITLPSTVISADVNNALPERIAFFLADPSVFVSTMQDAVGNSSPNLFVSLMNLMSKSVTDPLVSAVYFAMASRQYKTSDFIVSGYVSFTYPENVSLDDIAQVWVNRAFAEESIGLSMDLSIFGNKMTHPVDISGNFGISVDNNGSMVISSIDTYSVNGFYFTGGEFRF